MTELDDKFQRILATRDNFVQTTMVKFLRMNISNNQIDTMIIWLTENIGPPNKAWVVILGANNIKFKFVSQTDRALFALRWL
jgi:hypothetical protein